MNNLAGVQLQRGGAEAGDMETSLPLHEILT